MMSLLDARLHVLSDELHSIQLSTPLIPDEKGDMGEAFSKHAIKHVFYSKGFYAIKGSNKTFSFEQQYRGRRSGHGGIDYKLDFTINSTVYKCFIEMKNWDFYPKGVQNTWYNDHIKSRYTTYDPNRTRVRILAMNQKNIPSIQQRCTQDRINIVPIDRQILPDIFNPQQIKPVFTPFVHDLSTLIDDIISGKVVP